MRTNRRRLFGIGAAAAGAALLAPGSAAADETAGAPPVRAATDRVDASRLIEPVYRWFGGMAGGDWNGYVSVAGADGTTTVAVSDGPDDVLQALSVNKVAVAVAVLDKVDRGLISLSDLVDVTADIVIPDGDGMFRFDGAYPSHVTVGHAVANLLTISCDTSVRLCGLVAPSAEINEILLAKGFPNTQVEPVANPNRFFLGTSTPRETHDLFAALIAGELLSPASTAYIVNLLRSPVAFTDGVRREMSSAQRARIATKAGWFGDERHESGVMFDAGGAPVLTYSLWASGQGAPDDFGATHPAVTARAAMGRAFLDIVDLLPGVTALRRPAPPYRPSNGG